MLQARDLEFWEAVGRVSFDQRKFRKFEPVIFVEWKAPLVFFAIYYFGYNGLSNASYRKLRQNFRKTPKWRTETLERQTIKEYQVMFQLHCILLEENRSLIV